MEDIDESDTDCSNRSAFVTPAFWDRCQEQNPTSYDLKSPNGRIQIRIQTGERLAYDVLVSGKTVLRNSTLSMDIDHKTLGLNPGVKSAKRGQVDREIKSPVPQKSAKIRENYKELRLEMDGNYAVVSDGSVSGWC